jgi:transcriptional regulator with PAS, ATPase and Fis domain
LSKRNKQFFHSVNCSAIPETLFESEFFGHKKGSFTGAIENKAGWFEIANKGTLFLDEIGDMPLSQQAKLLRVLEERKVSRVGSNEKIDVDVRVITASNQELKDMSSKKEFRLDLYHRIGSFIIDLPPLRDRQEDIPLLIDYFINYYVENLGKPIKKIDPAINKELARYPFPGNIRELRNMVERALILCEDGYLKLDDFQLGSTEILDSTTSASGSVDTWDLELSERSLIKKALEKSNNNKSKAAELLNISWQSLDRRMKKFEIS